jgi:thiamine-phosphate diphosphorylase
MAAADARRLAPDAFLIGRSVHSLAEALAAERGGGCDYLTFGTVFPTTSKPGHTGAGLGALEALCAAVALPVLAIGGISVANAPALAAARASGVAAITLFAGDAGLAERIRAVRRSFDTCYPRKK